MIQMQDVTVFDLPVETKAYEQRIVMQNRNADFSSYTVAYTPKKPEIVAPQTTYISPIVSYLINRLQNGTISEQETSILSIRKGLISPSGAQLLDKSLSDALFAITDADLSKYKGPTFTQNRLRKKHYAGKKLSKAQAQKAFALSDREKVERNQCMAIETIAEIQNLLYNELHRRTGLKPKFKELPAVDKIICEAKNNPSENVKLASVCALGLLYRPDYIDDLTATFQDIAQTTSSKNIREQALGAVQKLSEEKAKLNK